MHAFCEHNTLNKIIMFLLVEEKEGKEPLHSSESAWWPFVLRGDFIISFFTRNDGPLLLIIMYKRLHSHANRLHLGFTSSLAIWKKMGFGGLTNEFNKITVTIFSQPDHYRSVKGAEFCHQFHPWFHRNAPYTLHVQIERRPRKFHDMESELRFKRNRFGRQATRVVAEFTFTRMAKCSEVCRTGDREFTTQIPLQVSTL
jgi:hypothetical protein